MKYNSWHVAAFSAFIIVFNACGMESSTLPQQISRQLIVAHSTEQKEKELLEDIIKYHPHQNPNIDFSIYTPLYFQELAGAIKITENKKQDPAIYNNRLKEDAITYINYVATNQQWPTVEDKLTQIKACLLDKTLFYLETTLRHNQPTMVISVIPKEEPGQESGTVEEMSSEEESEEFSTQEPTTPTTAVHQQASSTAQQPTFNKALPKRFIPREPQPNIFTQFISFVWTGIANTFNYLLSWLSWK